MRKNEIPLFRLKADLAFQIRFWVDLDTLLPMSIKKVLKSAGNAAAFCKFSLYAHKMVRSIQCVAVHGDQITKCHFRGELHFQHYFQFSSLTRFSFQVIWGAVLVKHFPLPWAFFIWWVKHIEDPSIFALTGQCTSKPKEMSKQSERGKMKEIERDHL